MIFWSTGMPIFAVVFFLGCSIFVFYCFLRMIRGAGWDGSDELHNMYRRDDNSSYEDSVTQPWRCPRPRCRVMNPGHARFCRMCGHHGRDGGRPS